MKRDTGQHRPTHLGTSSVWTFMSRHPLLIITLAACLCNALAFVFFYSIDRTLPRGGTASETRMTQQHLADSHFGHSFLDLEPLDPNRQPTPESQHRQNYRQRSDHDSWKDTTHSQVLDDDKAGVSGKPFISSQHKLQWSDTQHGSQPGSGPGRPGQQQQQSQTRSATADGSHDQQQSAGLSSSSSQSPAARSGGSQGGGGAVMSANMAQAVAEARQMLIKAALAATQAGDVPGAQSAMQAAKSGDDVIAQNLKLATEKWRKRLQHISGGLGGLRFAGDGGSKALPVKHKKLNKQVVRSSSSMVPGASTETLADEWEEIEVPTTMSDPNVTFPDPNVAAKQTEWPIWWFAPFFDRTSFGKEAATLLLGLIRSKAFPEDNIWVGTTQGDCNYAVDESMSRANFNQLDAANQRWNMSISAITVCHSLPPFWARPKNKWDTCFPCPPVGYTPAISIGRAMAETDIYHEEFVKYCNRMDEVWVPSDFSRDVLIRSGVERDKLRIVPIAVNTTLFDPDTVEAIALPVGSLVFGKHRRPVQGGNSTTTSPSAQSPVAKGKTAAHAANTIHSAQSRLGAVAGRAGSSGGLTRHFSTVASDSTNRVGGQALEPDGAGNDGMGDDTRAGQHDDDRTAGGGGVDEQVTEGDAGSDSGGGSQQALGRRGSLWQSTRDNVVSRGRKLLAALRSSRHAAFQSKPTPTAKSVDPNKPVVFLSCFKWEMRKGWDVLLASYLQEFTSEDNVELYILTKPFLSGNDFVGDMHTWVTHHLNVTGDQWQKLPTLYVISSHMSDQDYSALYKAADAFVIATRGEGWGMPISEAMSMGLPVVVTNWSGVTGFIDEHVGYMVDYKLVEVPPDQPWWFRGARWADAQVPSMRQRLREIVSNRHEARQKGQRARQRMVDKYSPEALAKVLAAEFNRLTALLRSGKCASKCHNKTWVAPLNDRGSDLYTGKESFLQDPLTPGQLDVHQEIMNVFGVMAADNNRASTSLQPLSSVVNMGVQKGADGDAQREAWKQLLASVSNHATDRETDKTSGDDGTGKGQQQQESRRNTGARLSETDSLLLQNRQSLTGAALGHVLSAGRPHAVEEDEDDGTHKARSEDDGNGGGGDFQEDQGASARGGKQLTVGGSEWERAHTRPRQPLSAGSDFDAGGGRGRSHGRQGNIGGVGSDSRRDSDGRRAQHRTHNGGMDLGVDWVPDG